MKNWHIKRIKVTHHYVDAATEQEAIELVVDDEAGDEYRLTCYVLPTADEEPPAAEPTLYPANIADWLATA